MFEFFPSLNVGADTFQEDKLEPSEQLGDLLRSAGDADAALQCYRSSGATTKVIEGKHLC